MSTNPWVWVAAILTLCIYSFLYRENPFYRFAEHLLVGVSAGYGMAIVWHNSFIAKVWDPLVIHHQWWVILPLLIGVLVLAIFIPKYNWLIRIPIAFWVGSSAGISVPLAFQTDIFRQMQGAILTPGDFPNFWMGISAVVAFIGVVATLTYFYFSKEHKGFIGKTARAGIIFIMIAFGASFGYTVMARVSLLVGRVQFLLHDWLGLVR